MKIPQLQIGDLIAPLPIVQGAMGVRVSLSSLASAVANEGGIGTIASVGLGDIEASKLEYERMSREALASEIRKAKALTQGPLAVNVMGVLSNSDDLIATAVREGIRMIVAGASLPLKLPGQVEDPAVSLVPIISSGRAAELVLRTWDKRYARSADGIILEGPLAGGHLGFSMGQLEKIEDYPLPKLLAEVLEAVKGFEDKYGKKIPVVAGGGVFNGEDIAELLLAGASGVQMATRFVCTIECDVAAEFKQAYLNAKEEDIIIIKSPVGLLGRAIRNQFIRDVEECGKLDIRCPYRCLSTCDVLNAKYCIAQALLNSCAGDVDHGLIFCGQNAYRVDKIVTVKELMAELRAELEAD